MKRICDHWVFVALMGICLLPVYWVACIVMGRDVLEYFDRRGR